MNPRCFMHNAISRRVFVSIALAALTTAFSVAGADDEAKAEKVRIVLVGDSTVTDQAGWGKAFAALLTERAECVNRARGGQSSKSFYDQGHWKRAWPRSPTSC